MKAIVLTGPESTGKTWLSGLLAGQFNTSWNPEFLREFYSFRNGIEQHQMEEVAVIQNQREDELLTQENNVVFFDTNIITLKVYYEYYFNQSPTWFKTLYQPNKYSHYLLLDTSIPWIEDSQRDSPEVRDELYRLFKTELEQLGVSFSIISGNYKERQQQALTVVKKILEG